VPDSVLKIARDHLQVAADQARRSLFPWDLLAPVKLVRAHNSSMFQLWLNGMCTEGLRGVARDTRDSDLKEFLQQIQHFRPLNEGLPEPSLA
jgi:hypothetical protein